MMRHVIYSKCDYDIVLNDVKSRNAFEKMNVWHYNSCKHPEDGGKELMEDGRTDMWEWMEEGMMDEKKDGRK